MLLNSVETTGRRPVKTGRNRRHPRSPETGSCGTEKWSGVSCVSILGPVLARKADLGEWQTVHQASALNDVDVDAVSGLTLALVAERPYVACVWALLAATLASPMCMRGAAYTRAPRTRESIANAWRARARASLVAPSQIQCPTRRLRAAAAWPRRACAPWMRRPGQHRSSCARAGPARKSPSRSNTAGFPLLPYLVSRPYHRAWRTSNTSSVRHHHRHSHLRRRPRTGRRGLDRPCRGPGTGKSQRKADQTFRVCSGHPYSHRSFP